MKKMSVRLLVFLLVLLPCIGIAQVSDSTYIVGSASAYKPDDDFNLFLLFFAIAVISFMCGVAIIGAGFAVFMLTVAAALIGTGVLSIAIVVGLIKRSLSSTVKILLYLTCSLTGAVAGVFGFWLMEILFHLQLSPLAALLGGLTAGLLGGLLWAKSSIFILKKARKYFEDLLLTGGMR
ncbi:MAG: hypothetical protein EOO04_28330 [Chitinophagaceae bacterium]|nr:MAG: hypothetical protein EOO04_28330 [Chitinophagaceae bacterium]